MRVLWRQITGLLIGLLVVASQAGECVDDCVPIGEWQFSVGLGLGWRNNPLSDGDDSPLLVLPELSYYGKRFFVENLDFGFTLLETPQHQLNVLLTPSSEQMFFNPWDPYNIFNPEQSSASPRSAQGSPPSSFVYTSNSEASLPESASSSSPVTFSSSSASSSAIAEPAEDLAVSIDLSNIESLRINGTNIDLSGAEVQQTDGDLVVTREGAALTANDLPDGSTIETTSIADADGDQLVTTYTTGSEGLAVTDERVQSNPQVASANAEVSVEEVKDRRMAGLAGFEYYYTGEHFGFHTQALQDITNIHRGYELRFALVLPWQFERSRWALTLGTNYKSQKLLDYYYGVHPGDTVDGSVLFEPDSAGFSKMLRLDWQKQLSKRWSLRGIVQYSWLPEPIHASPLVSDNYYNMIWVGGVYHF